MARSTTTFNSDTAPKGNKGAKHLSTKVKEAVGLTGWDRLCEFIVKDGADKYIETLGTLKGRDYIIAYNSLTEYVKPKLQRTTIEGDPDKPIQIQNTISQLSYEQLRELKYGK